MRNVEIKAKVTDTNRLLELAKGMCSDNDPVIIQQHDTFFRSPSGRLKLRVANDSTGKVWTCIQDHWSLFPDLFNIQTSWTSKLFGGFKDTWVWSWGPRSVLGVVDETSLKSCGWDQSWSRGWDQSSLIRRFSIGNFVAWKFFLYSLSSMHLFRKNSPKWMEFLKKPNIYVGSSCFRILRN